MGIRRFRMKLTLILVVLVGISVIVSGILTATRLKTARIESLQASMLREIQILNVTAPWMEEGDMQERIVYYSNLASILKQHANLRVTYVAADGTVLGDSDEEESLMDNHLSRPEIQQALQTGESGYSSRYSHTVNAEMLYVAVPVIQDGETVGFVRLAMSLQEVNAQIRQLWSYIIIGLLILFIVAVFVSYRVAHGLTRPLENIMHAAEQITQSNYEARVEITTKDEIGQLGRAINKMAMSLENQMQQIQQNESRLESVLDNMIIGVIMVDQRGVITLVNPSAENMLGFTSEELNGRKYDETSQHIELKRMIAEGLVKREMFRDEFVFYYPDERIIEVNLVPVNMQDGGAGGVLAVLHDITDLRRLERMRSEFVANVSHELKTPIAAVKGFAETLLAGAMDDPETSRSFLQIIYDESSRLDRLVIDILELSKIESRRIPLTFSPIHLSEFTGKTLEMLASEAAKKDIKLSMQVPDDLFLEADEDRLRQIVLNLLSNGINYTPNGGSVSVEARLVESNIHGEADSGVHEESERIRITVRDTGIGIPKKDLPRIFERFYRVDKARSRSSGGTGLGLSIVKHLVDLHKGTIQVESSQGMGTSFHIELPIIQ